MIDCYLADEAQRGHCSGGPGQDFCCPDVSPARRTDSRILRLNRIKRPVVIGSVLGNQLGLQDQPKARDFFADKRPCRQHWTLLRLPQVR